MTDLIALQKRNDERWKIAKVTGRRDVGEIDVRC